MPCTGGYQNKKIGSRIKGLTFLRLFKGKPKENCLRFANPPEALGGRHLEAQRQGGLEARRLQYVGLGKFLDVFDGFLRTSNT